MLLASEDIKQKQNELAALLSDMARCHMSVKATAAVSARSVYTIQPAVMHPDTSRKATHVRCMPRSVAGELCKLARLFTGPSSLHAEKCVTLP